MVYDRPTAQTVSWTFILTVPIIQHPFKTISLNQFLTSTFYNFSCSVLLCDKLKTQVNFTGWVNCQESNSSSLLNMTMTTNSDFFFSTIEMQFTRSCTTSLLFNFNYTETRTPALLFKLMVQSNLRRRRPWQKRVLKSHTWPCLQRGEQMC